MSNLQVGYTEKILGYENLSDELDFVVMNKLRPISINGMKSSYIGQISIGKNGAKPIFETPSFYSTGLFIQRRIDIVTPEVRTFNSTDFTGVLVLDQEFCNPWLVDSLEKMGRKFYAELLKNLPDLIQNEQRAGKISHKSLDDMVKEGSSGYSKYMKNPVTGGAFFVNCLPQALVFSQLSNAGAVTKSTVDESIRSKVLPKAGMYKVRLVPKHVYLGKHGDTYMASVKWNIDQLVYMATEFVNVPKDLTINVADFFTKTEPPTDELPTTVDEDIEFLFSTPTSASKKAKKK